MFSKRCAFLSLKNNTFVKFLCQNSLFSKLFWVFSCCSKFLPWGRTRIRLYRVTLIPSLWHPISDYTEPSAPGIWLHRSIYTQYPSMPGHATRYSEIPSLPNPGYFNQPGTQLPDPMQPGIRGTRDLWTVTFLQHSEGIFSIVQASIIRVHQVVKIRIN